MLTVDKKNIKLLKILKFQKNSKYKFHILKKGIPKPAGSMQQSSFTFLKKIGYTCMDFVISKKNPLRIGNF